MFNERFKAIRQASGKTQKELAEFLNISPQSVSKWEKGEALPSIEYLPLMAKFFGCSINVFFEEVYENTLSDKITEEIHVSIGVEEIKERIISAFSELKLNVEIVNVYEGVRVITFTCTARGRTQLKQVFNRYKEISTAVDDKMIMRGKDDENKTFVIEITKKQYDRVPLTKALESDEYKSSGCRMPIVIGYDTNDDLLIDDLATAPHILIGGDVHSGKTTFLRSLLTCLTSRFTKDELGIVVCDMSKSELLYANEYPHLVGEVLTSVDETEKALKCLREEMASRYAALEAFGMPDIVRYNEASRNKMKRLVIVVDELIDLLVYSDKIPEMLSEISMKGSQVGIHLVIATKHNHNKLEAIKIGIPTTVTFFTADRPSDHSVAGASMARSLCGCGDLIYCGSEHWCVRAQAPYIDAKEALKLTKVQ